MFKKIRSVSFLFAAIMLVSICVFADEKKETESISYASETGSGKNAAPDDIEIKQNGSFFGEDDLRRCREVAGKVLAGTGDDLGIAEFNDLDLVSISDSITVYKEGKFIYVVADPSPGMNQLYGYELISQDGGASWILNQFHRNMELGDMYIIDKNIMYIDGIGMETIAEPLISTNLGKTYKGLEVKAVTDIMSLPSMKYCYAYSKVKDIDVDKKTIVFDWYVNNYENAEDVSLFYRTEVSFPSFICSGGRDLSGLEKEAAQFRKTGFLFENSSSEKLNRNDISTTFLKVNRLVGAKKAAKEIRIAIDEIYARKGQDFEEEEIRDYFNRRKWYKPIAGKKVKEAELTEVEKYNINLLTDLEKEYKAAIIK